MRSSCGTRVGLSAAGKGPGIPGAVLGPGLKVACELSTPVPQVSLRGWQRGAQRSLGSVRDPGKGRCCNSLLGARSCGVPACVRSLSREASRSGTVLAWLRSDCQPVGKEVTREQLARPGEGTGWQGWHCGGRRSPSREGMRRAFPPERAVLRGMRPRPRQCGFFGGCAPPPSPVWWLARGGGGEGAPTLEGWSWPWRCWAGGGGRAGCGAARRGAGGRRQAVRGPRGQGCGAAAGPHPGPPLSFQESARRRGWPRPSSGSARSWRSTGTGSCCSSGGAGGQPGGAAPGGRCLSTLGHHDSNPFNFQRSECTESCYKYFLI